MKLIPTKEQISKLPKWAQDYITELERNVRESRANLDAILDNQTPTDYSSQDIICDQSPPRFITKYFDARGITASLDDLEVEFRVCRDNGYIQIKARIESSNLEPVFVPISYGEFLVFAAERSYAGTTIINPEPAKSDD